MTEPQQKQQQQQTVTTQPVVENDITQQVTTPTPATKPNTKNPKHVAAGKAVAAGTKIVREAQKRATAEANIIIAKNKADKAATKHTADKADKADNHKAVVQQQQEEAETHSRGFSWTAAGVVVAAAGVIVRVVTYLFKPQQVKSFLG